MTSLMSENHKMLARFMGWKSNYILFLAVQNNLGQLAADLIYAKILCKQNKLPSAITLAEPLLPTGKKSYLVKKKAVNVAKKLSV